MLCTLLCMVQMDVSSYLLRPTRPPLILVWTERYACKLLHGQSLYSTPPVCDGRGDEAVLGGAQAVPTVLQVMLQRVVLRHVVLDATTNVHFKRKVFNIPKCIQTAFMHEKFDFNCSNICSCTAHF